MKEHRESPWNLVKGEFNSITLVIISLLAGPPGSVMSLPPHLAGIDFPLKLPCWFAYILIY
jgi:hypothetical protein